MKELTIKCLIKLVSNAAQGLDKIKEGAVGSNGYGFVFRNYDYISQNSFLIGDGSSKFSSIGPIKNLYKELIEQRQHVEDIKQFLYDYDHESDLYIGGILKTLVPDIEFGGHESLFDVWMFVKTPIGKIFPATLYYRHSKVTIGAWRSDYNVFLSSGSKEFLKKFKKFIVFNPFDFSEVEKEEFIEALEFALAKVTISDFEGIYSHDSGRDLMGIQSGQPFITPLSKEEYRKLKGVKTHYH